MKDLFVNNRNTSLYYTVGSLTYGAFFLFLMLGNLARLQFFSSFGIPLLFTEALLYFFALMGALLQRYRQKEIAGIALLILTITLSFAYGALLFGFSSSALAYALRLIAMVLAGLVLGKYLFIKHAHDYSGFLRDLLSPFKIALLLGFFLFILFPYSSILWIFLEKIGVDFQGDPHIRRFVSVYFDPNYYCVLGLIPLLSAFFLWQKNRLSMIWVLLFLLSLVLTWSRSGLATLAAMGSVLAVGRISYKNRNSQKEISGVMGLGVFLLLVILFISFTSDEVGVFYRRFQYMISDESAQARVHSGALGVSYLTAAPSFGMGYNYLAQEISAFSGLNSVDSSLLAMIITFGTIPTLMGIYLMILYWIQENQRVKGASAILAKIFSTIWVYLFLVAVFASLFNNILFYPFWLVPMLVVFKYFHEAILDTGNERSLHQVLPDNPR